MNLFIIMFVYCFFLVIIPTYLANPGISFFLLVILSLTNEVEVLDYEFL